MSDEEDTTILLGTEKTVTEKEIKVTSKQTLLQNTEETESTAEYYLAPFAALLSGFSFAFDVGLAPALIKPITSSFNLTCTEQYYVVSSWLMGAISTVLFGGWIIDTLGRKFSLACFSAAFLLNIYITSTAYYFYFALLGRFISGFSGTLMYVTYAVYLTEISITSSRAYKVLTVQMGVIAGILMVAITRMHITDNSPAWRLALALVALPAAFQLIITVFCLPRSPHFLLLSSVPVVKRRSSHIRVVVSIETFMIAFGLIFFQQFTGQYTIQFYMPRLLALLGLCVSQAANITFLVIACTKAFAVVLCILIVDRLDRRILLIMSSLIMMTSMSLLSIFSSIDSPDYSILPYNENCHRLAIPESAGFIADPYTSFQDHVSLAVPKSPPPFPMLPTPLSLVSTVLSECSEAELTSPLSFSLRIIFVIVVLVYEAAYTLGLGTVPLLIISEIFPVVLRGRGVTIAMCLYWLMDFFVPNVFVTVFGMSLSFTFLFYSFMCMLSVMFTFLFVPETRNKSLHEVARDLRSMSLLTRMFSNLQILPFFSSSEWIKQKAQEYRSNNRPTVQSTVI